MLLRKLYTLTYVLSYLPMRLLDRVSGTDFSGIDEGHEDETHYGFYAPWASLPFLKACFRRELNGGRGHSILDVGCGKSFLLRFFSSLPFDRVAGIEREEDYCRIAAQNLKKAGASERVELFRADAAEFDGYGAFDVFYLYNPFHESVLEQCVDAILRAHSQAPGQKLTLIYCNPLYEEVLTKRGWQERSSFYYKTRVFS